MLLCFYTYFVLLYFFFFFFNDTATTEIYTLSLHDALPISWSLQNRKRADRQKLSLLQSSSWIRCAVLRERLPDRSEEHTSELQSHLNLVCRLLLEKKKKKIQLKCITYTSS